MARHINQAINPENRMPRISATPVRRPMVASRPRVLNLKGRGAWPFIPATMLLASTAA